MDYVPAPRFTEADKTNDKRYEVKLKAFWIVDKMEKHIKFIWRIEDVVMAGHQTCII